MDAEVRSASAAHGRPPGPPGHWLLGHLPALRKDVLGFVLDSATQLGGIVHLRLGPFWQAYLLSDPGLIEPVLVGNHRNFIKNRFFWQHVIPVVGQGLLTSEGEFWRSQRKLAAPGFSQQRIAAYGATMVGLTQQAMAGWRDGERRDFHRDMMALTSRIVAKTLFDEDVQGEEEGVGESMDILAHEIAHRMNRPLGLPMWVPTPANLRYRAAVRELDRLVYRFIAEHRKDGQPRNTLLAMLMAARDEGGKPMSDRQLRDESVTLFVAGHETTALALSWTVWLLSQHPGVERKLVAELEQVLAGRTPAVADLPALRYADCVIKESMRLYPPAYMIGRQAVADCEIGGYRIPAGATVYVSPWVMHHHPKFYDAPQEFRPERWTDGLEKKLPRFAYMPFGGGPRTCIGDRFALMEAVLLLAALLQRWHFDYLGAAAPTPFPSVTLRPAEGLPVRLSAR
jgi:cytochrome P450